MLIEHQHKPGEFDPGHCRDCARETDLVDHYHHVQHQERTVKEAHRWARQARRTTTWGPVVIRRRGSAGRHRSAHGLSHRWR
jgi:hypothetical protein